MKEMEYSAERKIEVLDTGYFYGLLYYIMNLGTHPTAYVKIPETHWLYNIKDYDDMPIECHYGLTYLRDYLRVSDTEKVEGRFIGWDYGHCTDYAGYFETLNIGLDGTEAKKWTTEEIQKEVKDVCYQIIELEKKKPSEAKGNKTMTNAEKYRLTGIEAYNLSQELGEYLTIEKKADGVFVSDINSFFARATKPTLTEDERVILRNIKNVKSIKRDNDGDLLVYKIATGVYYITPYNHLFQFIKNGEEYSIEELLDD